MKSLEIGETNTTQEPLETVSPLLSPLTPKNSFNGIDLPLQDPVEEFFEEISTEPQRVEIWKKFLSEKYALEQFCYYEDYIKYKNEKNEEEKKLKGDFLIEEYISLNGKTSIGVSENLIKRCKKYHDLGSDKGFQLVLRQVSKKKKFNQNFYFFFLRVF